MKAFKRLAVLTLIALSAICMTVFASACNNAKEFTATVYYSDGTTVVDGTKTPYLIQVCVDGGACYMPMDFETALKIDANGKFTIAIATIEEWVAEIDSITTTPESYVLHVMQLNGTVMETTQEVTVSKSKPNVKLVLKDVAAPQN